jgi:2-polyprenyl-3-methyl-5-hydroxy-6-metoxy-1,4-benzoquinol methylase
LSEKFLDLGVAPPSNAYLREPEVNQPETFFPLEVYVCSNCWLVQTRDFNRSDELFDKDYAYFSSTSKSWLAHAKKYCDGITERLELSSKSHVVEVASNDGYLLKNFVDAGVPCLGIEPTASTADVAVAAGVPTLQEFFGERLAKKLATEGRKADLIIGNNVFAHVPDINGFSKGLAALLKPQGTITLEFPHLLNLVDLNQFDTIYHEHYSYLSLIAVSNIFVAAGLRVYDVDQLTSHGGSLRIYGCLRDAEIQPTSRVDEILSLEEKAGIGTLNTYSNFQQKADHVKNEFLAFLLERKALGQTVGAYGAAAKGNTILNYAGVKPDLLPFVCDAAASKQHKFMPGSRIPIMSPDHIEKAKPDYLIILPWNLSSEISQQLSIVRSWGGKFVTAVPKLRVF